MGRAYESALQEEREGVGQRVETLGAASVALDDWLTENDTQGRSALVDGEGAEQPSTIPDQAFIAQDDLAAQVT